MTDYPYKSKIEDVISEHTDKFIRPNKGHREFPLEANCKADFAYAINPNGMLFIEDDDGARAVSNLIKYWIWTDKHNDKRPTYVVHIVENSRRAQIINVRFLAEKIHENIIDFHYHIIEIKSWQDPYEEWMLQFRKIINEIATQKS